MSVVPATIVDTHCHLDYLARHEEAENNDPAEVMARATAEGLAFIVNPCVSPRNFDDVMAITGKLENVYAAVAIHPTDVTETAEFPDWLERTEALLAHPKVVAIGETGLDYYWSTDHVDTQKACLRQFLELGARHDLPVIIHDRDRKSEDDFPTSSHDDIYELIKSVSGVRGIMHCFSGDAEYARRMIALNFHISFAGNLTFKKATNLHEAARETPLERILVETDTPFLSPVPFRGKPNEPARVRYVVEKIAELKGIPYEEVARVTTENARRVFGL